MIKLEHLPVLSENFEVDKVDALPVAEISFVRYNYSYIGGRKVVREKVIQVFGIDGTKENIYGCHTIEEENGRKFFNLIGGDQNNLLKIPLSDIVEYNKLK